MNKTYLTEKELAARWNLLSKTLRQWRWYKKGPKYSKLGGRISYRTEDIESFEEENVIGTLKEIREPEDKSDL